MIGKKQLSDIEKIGILIGIILTVILLMVCCYCFTKKCRKQTKSDNEEDDDKTKPLVEESESYCSYI